MKASPRVYADTSVFGGCFDPEFDEESRVFFEQVSSGKFVLPISDLTVRELENAPREVREFYSTLTDYESVSTTDECSGLRDAYLRADVLGRASADDALHVAIATVYRADMHSRV